MFGIVLLLVEGLNKQDSQKKDTHLNYLDRVRMLLLLKCNVHVQDTRPINLKNYLEPPPTLIIGLPSCDTITLTPNRRQTYPLKPEI